MKLRNAEAAAGGAVGGVKAEELAVERDEDLLDQEEEVEAEDVMQG